MSSPDAGFRSFALAVYARPGVSDAALQLQDDCDVDVNVVLFAAYVGAARGAAFGPDELADVQRRVGPWQQDVVRPLRAVRRGLKAGPPPAPTADTEALREGVKKLELEAELIELDQLTGLAERGEYTVMPGTAQERAEAAMRVVTGGRGVDAIAVIAIAAAGSGSTG